MEFNTYDEKTGVDANILAPPPHPDDSGGVVEVIPSTVEENCLFLIKVDYLVSRGLDNYYLSDCVIEQSC